MQKEYIFQYEEIVDFKLLSDLELQLFQKAIDISKSAYAPYSKFNVGVALLLENNEIITGSNQENVSFPCGICAERVALFAAKSKYPKLTIEKIVITASSQNFELDYPVGPCGICRQVLIEYEDNQNKDIEIFLFDTKKIIKLAKAKHLLPFHFKEDRLKNK